MQLKTLHVLLSSGLSDSDQTVIEDIESLCQLNHGCRVVCLENSEIHKKIAERLQEQAQSTLILVKQPPKIFLDLQWKTLLQREINQGVQLVHIYGSNFLGSILPWMLTTLKVPVVVSESPLVYKQVSHFFQSLFYFRIDALIVPTRAIKKRVQLMRRSLEQKIKVIHHGLDLTAFRSEDFDFSILRTKWGVIENENLVGMIASNEYTKAQAAFIKAAASFLRNTELAQQTRFIIVGFDEAKSKDLIQLIQQFHLQEKIILAPNEDNIPKVLGAFDVYVIPSSKAMFGLRAVGSLAMGTPIICATGPDSVEWIGNSKAGLLMRSGDSFDLQRKLKQILENPQELKAMGKRAVEYVQLNYSRKVRTQKIQDLYSRLIEKRA